MKSITTRTLLATGAVLFCAAGTQAVENTGRPPEPVRIVLFVPSDLPFPAGAQHRLTQIADAAEAFFFTGMTRNGYPPETKSLFRREADGQVEVLPIRGEETAASGKYANPTYSGYVIKKAVDQYHVPKDGTVWWIFVYLGDRPTRFDMWMGMGNPRAGGWAMVNYDTVPGEIRPDLQLTEGFNFVYMLKSTIHELAHAFGLMHMGPDPTLDMGNSLMGPNPPMYATRPSFTKGDHVYLAASEAAMLWRHPLFRAKAMPLQELTEAKVADYKSAFDPGTNTVTVSGKLVSSMSAHSVVLIDNRGDPDQYWSRSYAARLAPDNSFQIKINDPAKADGEFRILFCFDSGGVSGNGTNVGPRTHGDLRKKYHFKDGLYHFEP